MDELINLCETDPKEALRWIRREKDRISLARYNDRHSLWDKETVRQTADTEYVKRLNDHQKRVVLQLRMQRNALRFARQSAPKHKHYCSKRLNSVMDTCCFCLNQHTLRESVHTDCGHYFGKACYQAYQAANGDKKIACPLCRKVEPIITIFNERKH